MSVDVLQEKIRKTRNPSMVLFEASAEVVAPQVLETAPSLAVACQIWFSQLLDALQGIVPAVRFGFASFAMLGADGLAALQAVMAKAKDLGFYVVMDLPEVLTVASAQALAAAVDGFACDGVIMGTYLGSDVLHPMRELCKKGKSVFAVVRTANRSAGELQDLMTGGRLVHTAAADIVSRHGESVQGKCGYSLLGAVAAAASADSLRTLRSKYSRLFLLLDGYDYPNSNAKNCSFAFDRFGHGAVACAAGSVVGAWREGESGQEPCAAAVAAAERMKKNLTRYISVL